MERLLLSEQNTQTTEAWIMLKRIQRATFFPSQYLESFSVCALMNGPYWYLQLTKCKNFVSKWINNKLIGV
jgi:hypothetical protein